MTLYEGDVEHIYTVKELCIEQSIMRRLEALGLNEGSKVLFLNRKKKGALIIKVRGTRLAIGKKIAQGIEVEEDANERHN
jgi:ferrous iron transport protein A